MSDYEFDVFLSYSRKGSSGKWVHNHFLPKLRDCLTDEIGIVPKIFVDQEMDVGSVWPSRLEQELMRSKILVAIYSAQYFQSDWCVAEWKSMAAREDLLGLASPDLTRGLIFPVLYSDSHNFPEFGLDRMWHDMKGYDNPDPMFQQSLDWLEFHRRMRRIAVDVENMLLQVPKWQADWPVVRPDVPIRATTKFPGW
ncbi:toll/interleukin-1 receptor domain-containing protein [Actinophytocola oryzae]|uniref:toll/interleukin-1 receptor domain-containing protein n=1 Tax=Actinophytocola oryzae TaxID=502181 RepID=UPI0014151C15|nr:toll/interleukin-1 receptor domain-containing protein [Actinophytocola oryzae]